MTSQVDLTYSPPKDDKALALCVRAALAAYSVLAGRVLAGKPRAMASKGASKTCSRVVDPSACIFWRHQALRGALLAAASAVRVREINR